MKVVTEITFMENKARGLKLLSFFSFSGPMTGVLCSCLHTISIGAFVKAGRQAGRHRSFFLFLHRVPGAKQSCFMTGRHGMEREN